jgi:hypothetical protein
MPRPFPNLLQQSAAVRAGFVLLMIAALWLAIHWAVILP